MSTMMSNSRDVSPPGAAGQGFLGSFMKQYGQFAFGVVALVIVCVTLVWAVGQLTAQDKDRASQMMQAAAALAEASNQNERIALSLKDTARALENATKSIESAAKSIEKTVDRLDRIVDHSRFSPSGPTR